MCERGANNSPSTRVHARGTPRSDPFRCGETPGEVFTAWLHRFFAFFTSKRHIASELLLEHVDPDNPVFGQNRARVHAAGRPLLLGAQEAHEVRADLTLEQVLDMIIAIATIHGDTRYLQPILQVALDGLRPPPDLEGRR